MKYTPPIGGEPNDPYIDANPAAGIEGSAVPAAAVEGPQRELHNLIDGLGGTPDPEDFTQVFALLLSSFAVASGRADQVFRVAEAVGQSDAVPLAQLEALLAVGSEGGKLRRMTIHNTAGTYAYAKPAWLKFVVSVVGGAGGSGGGVRSTASGEGSVGSGGAPGGVSIKKIQAGDLAAEETVTIGAAGVAVTGNVSGNNGGTSSFGTHHSAPGGQGGGTLDRVTTLSGSTDSTPGVGVGGDLNFSGSPGEGGLVNPATFARSGRGGNSIFGGAGRSARASAAGQSNGNPATGPCSGGSGALSRNGTEATSGAGADGLWIGLEYE